MIRRPRAGHPAGAHEDDGVAVQLIDQQEVPADMAFPVIGPITLERVVVWSKNSSVLIFQHLNI